MDKSQETALQKEPQKDHAEDVVKVRTNGRASDEEEEPKTKLARWSEENDEPQIDLTLNHNYTRNDFIDTLQIQWNGRGKSDYTDATTGAKVYLDPFQICLLPNLLEQGEGCQQLVDEMVEKVHWSRKQMDLYEFYQSTDLSNMVDCKLLTSFLQMLRRTVRPWLEKVTNLRLDYVSASCSMYTCGDYLLVHDDLLKDRQVAFIYYLSPWKNAEEWNEEQGGCLEIFTSDEQCFPQFPIYRHIPPKNNQFAFFKVGSRSFHQVGEVTNFDYPRLTINGWFHGASNDDLIADALRPFVKLDFRPPSECAATLDLLNEVYLKPSTRCSIQRRIEDNSEICLYEFFKRDIFEQTLTQLLNDETLRWQHQGPANAQNYEVLDLKTATKTLRQMIELFTSTEMFTLLRDYTDLDLAGPNADTPSYNLELQRWSHGNYTVLGDGAICEENTLDLIYYLNAAEGAGVITYLSPDAEEAETKRSSHSDSDSVEEDEDEDESVLLSITPVDNSLNIVYRCEGTTKFTKYVSRNTPLEQGPVFIISCSYKE